MNMHNELTKISEENVLLESNVRLANFQREASSRLSISEVSNNFENLGAGMETMKTFNDSGSSGKGFRNSELSFLKQNNPRAAIEPITKFQF